MLPPSIGNAENVKKLFASIARRYDLGNRLLSLSMDIYWRNVLIYAVKNLAPKKILDVATGSGDVAFLLSKKIPEATVVGVDFCKEMLEVAESKKNKESICFKLADCACLPFDNHSFDVVTIAFGIRNFEDRHRCLNEVYRVLKPKGVLFILEFTQPYFWIKPFYLIYLKYVLPVFAHWITGKKSAYDYLGLSIQKFPDSQALCVEIKNTGFDTVGVKKLTAGLVAIHQANK